MGGGGEQYLTVMFFVCLCVCFSAACLAIFLVSSISQEQSVHLGWLSGMGWWVVAVRTGSCGSTKLVCYTSPLKKWFLSPPGASQRLLHDPYIACVCSGRVL